MCDQFHRGNPIGAPRSMSRTRRSTRVLVVVSMVLAMAPIASAVESGTAYHVIQEARLVGEGGWDYLTFDAASRHLFVARSDRVQVFDPQEARLVGEIPGMQGVHGVALANELGLGFATSGRANSVAVFDLKTLSRRVDIPIQGKNPDAILYLASMQRVYTFNGSSHDVTVIDARTLSPLATIALDGKPEFAATDGTLIFANIEDRAELVTFDAKSSQIVRTVTLPGCEEPTGLALDASDRRLFSVCSNGRMIVTDADSGRQVADLAIGRGPDAVVFDAGNATILVSCGEGILSVIHMRDANHFAPAVSVATRNSARTLALDPLTHNVYLVAAQFAPAPSGAQGSPNTRAPMVPGSFMLITVAP
jgi:YVTN family beta-propeller protein